VIVGDQVPVGVSPDDREVQHALPQLVQGVLRLPVPFVQLPMLPFQMRSWKNLSHYVKYCIIIEGITDFLKLFEETTEDASFNGVGSYKIKDKTVLFLAITMYSVHTLFETVRVPGDIIVE